MLARRLGQALELGVSSGDIPAGTADQHDLAAWTCASARMPSHFISYAQGASSAGSSPPTASMGRSVCLLWPPAGATCLRSTVASLLGVTSEHPNLMRERAGPQRVTHIELFFDLVYVFAVTQLSHFLLAGPTAGAVRTGIETAVLLIMVWQLWAYTTWVTNWLDPDLIAVRLLLLALAVISLVMSAALPSAFTGSGLIVGVAYLVMQVGRSVFAVVAIADPGLRRNFQRILVWCVVSGLFALGGGLAHGDARIALWACAVLVDGTGGAVGFYTPRLGRSRTADWTIEGGHLAERCQGFILIAIGESIIVIGATLADRLSGAAALTLAEIAAFVIAVVTSVAFWWLYFDRSARDATEVISHSADPGRLGRSAYHFIHPVMVAGIIVTAAADGATAVAAGRSSGAGPVTGWVAGLILVGRRCSWLGMRRSSW